MDNKFGFCKRNLPNRKISKYIYTFYNDPNTFSHLICLSNKLLKNHSAWLIKHYDFGLDITYGKILQKVNTPYHKHSKELDKICIISCPIVIKNSKIPIEYFSSVLDFEQWLNDLLTS